MDSRKLTACSSGMAGKWRRPAVGLAVAVTAGLLVLAVVHLSPREEGHDGVGSPRDRSRRAASATSSVQNATPVPVGAVYTHWGRADCPTSAQIVYKGIMGSQHSSHTGGGGEYLCLTNEPEWLLSTVVGYSHVYGVEYQTNHVGRTSGQNAVCTVCQSTRTNKLMIPGRISCVDGWTREYYGYLMSSKYTDKSTRNYVCVGNNSQADWASNPKSGGGQLWHVLAACGALPCPKYKQSLITCVLCTR